MKNRVVEINLAQRSYDIVIGYDLADQVRAVVEHLQREGRGVAVITDSQVAAAQPRFLEKVFAGVPCRIVPAGESTKSLSELEGVLEFLSNNHLDRHSVLFAWGGGVVGDLAGFAAASYLRGIDFYQVPTSLLAMVDSSVGGKTGVNLSTGKNLVGAFHQPKGVFSDLLLLETLPENEFSAGMAEVIKAGLLGDIDLYQRLLALDRLHPQHPAMAEVVESACLLKARVVQADERELAASGGRALLNLGHTFAHAIENVAGYGDYLHGEAVAIGLVLAMRLSQRMGYLSIAEEKEMCQLLELYHLPMTLRQYLPINELLDAMFRDKKVKSGKINFVVLRDLGDAITSSDVVDEWIRELWAQMVPDNPILRD